MYIPLRIYSQFSVGFGAVKIEDIIEHCKAEGIPAAGFADHNSLAGALTLCKSLSKAGIQPLVGTSIDITDGTDTGALVLYARGARGYAALLRVVNARNTAKTPAPHTLAGLADLIADDADDIIALSGGEQGLIGKMIEADRKVLPVFAQLMGIFGKDFYIEIQRDSAAPGPQEAVLTRAAAHFGLPLVATGEAHYAKVGGEDAHDAFLCIADKTYLSQDNRRKARAGRHLLSLLEMHERFGDLPQALENSVEIARRTAFMLEPAEPSLPAFPTEGGETEACALRRQAKSGLDDRLSGRTGWEDGAGLAEYRARLDYELDTIAKMGFPGYFLIVADFIGWARGKDIPVGPGRGSGAGSLVAYALGITDIDPIPFGLIFERFLNPERVSMPDFDIDFCQERRDEVIGYVRAKYGATRVAHIAAFGTLQARAAVRDVARVMQIPYPVADRFAKMIPANPANPVTLVAAMQEEVLSDAIARADDTIREMFDIAVKLEGLYRHVSTHAAGIIISDRPVDQVVPVHLDSDGKLATSYEMKATESSGLVKFDFLGLKNLDVIKGTTDFVKATTGEVIDLAALEFRDARTYAQLAGGDGFAVFQLESPGMRQAMKQLRVDGFEDLIALISLYRPGPMDQIKTYAAVKRGDEDVQYAHEQTREVLEPTNGVMIYQEQVMEIARRLAGYSMGEADLLRRAMGKKIQSEMDAQRDRFCEGAAKGWVEIHLDTGEVRKVHADARFVARDGSGRQVTIAQAIAEGIDIAA